MNHDPSLGRIHPVPTKKSKYRYFFYVKHHAAEDHENSQWANVTPEEEFSIFDSADENDIFVETGSDRNYFGILVNLNSLRVQTIGTKGQQVAKFPHSRSNTPWHGFPLFPIDNDSSRKNIVPREAIDRMVEVGMITAQKASRLKGGKRI